MEYNTYEESESQANGLTNYLYNMIYKPFWIGILMGFGHFFSYIFLNLKIFEPIYKLIDKTKI